MLQEFDWMLQNINCQISCISELSKPLTPHGEKNNYDIFEAIGHRYGVYVFVDESDAVLYVGKAPKQSLKKRIKQYYTLGNSGGTFRKNWLKEGNRCFEDFKNALGSWKLVTVSTLAQNASWILPLEGILISLLEPKYNKNG